MVPYKRSTGEGLIQGIVNLYLQAEWAVIGHPEALCFGGLKATLKAAIERHFAYRSTSQSVRHRKYIFQICLGLHLVCHSLDKGIDARK